jgi:hypothetical protein
MSSDRPEEPDHGIDVEAAFADIVAHYGDLPTVEDAVPAAGQTGGPTPPHADHPTTDPPADPSTGESAAQPAGEPTGEPPRPGPADPSPRAGDPQSVLEPGWDDPLHTPATWDDEGHFVPPPPPPLPSVEPRRRAAWLALFGAPLVMLVVIVAGVGVPGWVVAALALAFIGGFVYLVATMGRSGGGPGWPDDGAVV